MHQRTAILTALLVLLVGGAVALLFRKDAAAENRSISTEDHLVRRRIGEATITQPRRDEPAVPQPVDSADEASSTSLPVASLSRFDQPDPAPPSVVGDYPDFAAIEPQWRPEQESPTSATDEEPRITPSSASGVIVHQVVDGDTLPSLAAKYLGDAGRSQEIFDGNRHLLKRPDLLPIGAPLRIVRSGD